MCSVYAPFPPAFCLESCCLGLVGVGVVVVVSSGQPVALCKSQLGILVFYLGVGFVCVTMPPLPSSPFYLITPTILCSRVDAYATRQRQPVRPPFGGSHTAFRNLPHLTPPPHKKKNGSAVCGGGVVLKRVESTGTSSSGRMGLSSKTGVGKGNR
ncbi:hypothetical protein OPV22_030667 [Ensete ventricosum]|uniref:DUF4005 domain-containing protein n=1 Tax=Ensete ventricosum TaxID=4639 RepID=A0AAV8Q9Q6_ENSVE|nr:hypothetical protein OPV22_030667 [Ensete ventricosum]